MSDTVRDDLGRLLVHDVRQIQEMPWEPLRDLEGVTHKVLWQSGATTIGLIRVEPGVDKPGHVHHGAHHHILVLSGSCTMVGRHLPAGSYVYIPPGVEHEVSDVGAEGCEYFYTYRPLEQPPRREPDVSGYVMAE